MAPARPGGAVRAFVVHLWRHRHNQTGIRLLGMMMMIVIVVIIMLTFVVDRAVFNALTSGIAVIVPIIINSSTMLKV